jgi:MFS transporter, DHA1 family, multidrug resistance protein
MLLGYFEFFRSSRYVGYVACSTLYFCCLFAFIAASLFVYIDYFRVPPQYYGFLFGVNMLGMIASTFINSRIVLERGSDQLLRLACVIGAIGGLALLVTGLAGAGGIVGLAVPVFIGLSLLTMWPPTQYQERFRSFLSALERQRPWQEPYSLGPARWRVPQSVGRLMERRDQ